MLDTLRRIVNEVNAAPDLEKALHTIVDMVKQATVCDVCSVYLTDPDPRGSMGLGGKRTSIVGFDGNAFNALDYRTGEAVWRHEWPGGGGVGAGVLTTTTNLVFTGDGNGNLLAFDAENGDILWHTRIGNITNAPQTYMLDGRQHLLVAVGDTLYDFVLY